MKHEKINYLELPAKDLLATKLFFTQVFNWKFTDYGKEYIAFTDGVMEGGFYQSKFSANTENGSVLVVFYSKEIRATRKKIITYGGKIQQEIFSFPGGCRFHFLDPNGNEYAVWSESEFES